jgi:HCOMODA/2-hydroxy-3-carboxy-muconic semialdehyde decarboxylase
MNGEKRPVYLERFIHSEIFRARPDVKAVVHSHSYAVIPFGTVATKRLRAMWHMAGFLGTDTPIFEIRDHAGDESDLLIRDNPLGVALAKSLGDRNAVLMRGHGCTVVGDTLPEVVYRGVYTDLNARIQLQTIGLGEDPVYLTAGEAHATTMANKGQLSRAWDMWTRKVQKSQTPS